MLKKFCNSRLIFAYYIFEDFPKEINANTLIDELIKIMNIVYLYVVTYNCIVGTPVT